jgi:hypothetical protein
VGVSFEHPPTQAYAHSAARPSFPTSSAFLSDEVLFVPQFLTYSGSFQRPQSGLLLFSTRECTVRVIRASLISAGSADTSSIDVNRDVALVRHESTSRLYLGSVLLFDPSNSDVKSLGGSALLVLRITFTVSPDSVVREMVFELKRRTEIGIPWPT